MEVAKTVATDGFKVTGSDFSLTATSKNPFGDPIYSQENLLVLAPLGVAVVQGKGFKPNSNVDVWLFSTPTYLGKFVTNKRGEFVGNLKVPGTLAEGSHTMQINGQASDGLVRSVNVGVLVGFPSKPNMVVKKVYFKSGSAELSSSAKKAIRSFVKANNASKLLEVIVDGWAKPSRSFKADKLLSAKRARAVTSFIERLLPNADVTTLANGPTWSNNVKSQRAEITLVVNP